jgi:hypothetical protein
VADLAAPSTSPVGKTTECTTSKIIKPLDFFKNAKVLQQNDTKETHQKMSIPLQSNVITQQKKTACNHR